MNRETPLDRRVQRPKAWSSYEVASERALPDRKAGSWIGRYKSKCSRIQPPISRNWLPGDVRCAAVQIDGNAGNQIWKIGLTSPVRQRHVEILVDVKRITGLGREAIRDDPAAGQGSHPVARTRRWRLVIQRQIEHPA